MAAGIAGSVAASKSNDSVTGLSAAIAAFASPVKGAKYAATLASVPTVSKESARLFMAQWHAFSSSIPAFLSLCAWRAGSELERVNIKGI